MYGVKGKIYRTSFKGMPFTINLSTFQCIYIFSNNYFKLLVYVSLTKLIGPTCKTINDIKIQFDVFFFGFWQGFGWCNPLKEQIQATKICGTKVWGGSLDFNLSIYAKTFSVFHTQNFLLKFGYFPKIEGLKSKLLWKLFVDYVLTFSKGGVLFLSQLFPKSSSHLSRLKYSSNSRKRFTRL